MEERKSTVRVARVDGIDIYIHYSWMVIAGLIVLGFWGQMESQYSNLDDRALAGLAVFGSMTFFGSVLLHELAHAIVAKYRGIEVKGITLYLFGGATEADVDERSALDEFLVAVVGPLTSFALSGILQIASLAIGSTYDALAGLLSLLALVNLVLAVFNLAPGLPLDGGRVFRSAVWGITGDFERATRWATSAGVGIGYAITALGLLSLWQGTLTGLWLMAIGWMISQSARRGGQRERLRSTFDDLVAGDVMTSPVITIPANASIAVAVRDHFSRRNLTVYPVVENDQIFGLLTTAGIRSTPASDLWKTTAGHVAIGQRPALIAKVTTPMSEVIAALSTNTETSARVLVVEHGRLVGIISPSDVLRRFSLADLMEPALADPTGSRWRPGSPDAGTNGPATPVAGR